MSDLPIQIDPNSYLQIPSVHDSSITALSWKGGSYLHITLSYFKDKTFQIHIPSVEMVVADEYRVNNIVFDLLFCKLQGKAFISKESFLVEVGEVSRSVRGELLGYFDEKDSVIVITCSFGGSIIIVGGFSEETIRWSESAS